MKRISRFLGVFLCLAIVISVSVFAGSTTIDVSTADEGFFTVNYDASSDLKMKVGVNYGGKTTYYNYTPDTAHLLERQQGVCYDFSALFAAMCRSQGIPCAVAKGYTTGGYHAWNMVYMNDAWVAIDMTLSIAYGWSDTDEMSDFTVSMNRYYNYAY